MLNLAAALPTALRNTAQHEKRIKTPQFNIALPAQPSVLFASRSKLELAKKNTTAYYHAIIYIFFHVKIIYFILFILFIIVAVHGCEFSFLIPNSFPVECRKEMKATACVDDNPAFSIPRKNLGLEFTRMSL